MIIAVHLSILDYRVASGGWKSPTLVYSAFFFSHPFVRAYMLVADAKGVYDGGIRSRLRR